ncbi:Uncharacterised protein [Bordetella pertussis]|nr:Uncharacterised protein [Bordetella pertussis]
MSLPSVSRISILSRSPAWSSMRMPRPMASPSAVLGPAMPTAVRCSSRRSAAWSRVSGACG